MAADPDMEEDLFADLYDQPKPTSDTATLTLSSSYDGEADDPPAPTESAVKTEPQAQQAKIETAPEPENEDYNNDDDVDITGGDGGVMQDMQGDGAAGGNQNGAGQQHDDNYDRPIGIKEDG